MSLLRKLTRVCSPGRVYRPGIDVPRRPGRPGPRSPMISPRSVVALEPPVWRHPPDTSHARLAGFLRRNAQHYVVRLEKRGSFRRFRHVCLGAKIKLRAGGENVSILYRSAENEIDRLPGLAVDLARRGVAVIAAAGNTAAFAAKNATAMIPILFIAGEDPVRLGLVTSLARPAGNLTGVNIFATELTAKRVALLRNLVPTAARVAVLVDPANETIAGPTLREVRSAAHAMDLKIQVLNASNGREIGVAFAALERDRPDALFVSIGPLFSFSARATRHLGGTPHNSHDIRQP
jgi:ABC transporter substrate binding protein